MTIEEQKQLTETLCMAVKQNERAIAILERLTNQLESKEKQVQNYELLLKRIYQLNFN